MSAPNEYFDHWVFTFHEFLPIFKVFEKRQLHMITLYFIPATVNDAVSDKKCVGDSNLIKLIKQPEI